MGPSPLGGYQQFWLNITKLINIIYITFSSQTHTSKWYICKYLYIHIITRYMTRPQLTFRTVLRRWTSFTKKTFRFASRWNISTGFPATRILATRMKRRRRQVIDHVIQDLPSTNVNLWSNLILSSADSRDIVQERRGRKGGTLGRRSSIRSGWSAWGGRLENHWYQCHHHQNENCLSQIRWWQWW